MTFLSAKIKGEKSLFEKFLHFSFSTSRETKEDIIYIKELKVKTTKVYNDL
jgi:hypothetical protein